MRTKKPSALLLPALAALMTAACTLPTGPLGPAHVTVSSLLSGSGAMRLTGLRAGEGEVAVPLSGDHAAFLSFHAREAGGERLAVNIQRAPSAYQLQGLRTPAADAPAHGLFSFGLAPKIAQVTFDTPDPWGMRKDFRYTIKHIQVEDASVQGSLPVDLAGDLTLRSATAIVAGERLAVDVLWQGSPLAEESADAAYYTAFVQLLDDQSQRLAGSDVLLSPEMAEVSVPDPQQADVFISRHEMMVPPGLSPGRHPLLVGLYYLEDGDLVNVGSVVVQAELAPGPPGSD